MRIACIQINSDDDMTVNILKTALLVEEAVQAGAQFVALPENVFFMDASTKDKPCVLYSEEEHPGILAASKMARLHGIWLLVGSVAVKVGNSGKSVNHSLLFSPTGDKAAYYDKIHLFDVELPGGEVYTESARMLHGSEAVLTSMSGAKLGMTICYDVRFPHLYRTLAKAGAHILAIPAAFTATTGEAHWHVLLRARAIETGCFVIAPAQTGTHPGNRKTFGHSLIIDPWGVVLADGGVEEGVVMSDIDLDMVSQVRARIPALEHDREFILKA